LLPHFTTAWQLTGVKQDGQSHTLPNLVYNCVSCGFTNYPKNYYDPRLRTSGLEHRIYNADPSDHMTTEENMTAYLELCDVANSTFVFGGPEETTNRLLQ